MNRVKIILIACLFGLFASPAFAQCSGQTPSGNLCGNDGASQALPGWKTQTSILDRNFGAPSAQGSILNRGASVWSATSTPVLGLPNTTTGSIGFAGSNGGTVTVKSQDTAGTWTFKLPTTGGSNGFVLTTDGSGNSTWANPASGGTVTSVGLALPSSILTVSGSPVTISGTLTGTLATQSANLVWAGPQTGSAATPTFRSLIGTDLPNPSSSTLGGIQSYAGVSSQWIRSISTSGVPASSQPAFSDISGTLGPSQCPNPSASTLGCIESLVPVTSKWINQISTAGVPIATQPNFTDLSGNASLAQLPTIGNNSVLGNNSGGTSIPSALTGTQVIDFIGSTQGNVLYRNGTIWTVLAPGTNGQVLTSGGAAANPSWTTVSGTGTVTSIATGNGITGGTITTTGTLGLSSIAAGTVLANITGGSTFPSSNTPSAVLDIIGSTEGQILYRGASAWLALGPGTSGQVLQTQGAGATPQWANASSLSSITAGTGLTGGTITTSGTIALANTAVSAGSYTTANITVDAQGRLTAASTGTASAQNNFLINGNTAIDQPNEGASYSINAAADNPVIDGWRVHVNTTASGLTAQRVADAPIGFNYSLKVTVGTGAAGVAAGDFLAIYQPMTTSVVQALGNGNAGSSTSSISCWFKTSLSNPTWNFFLKNSGGNRTYIANFNIPSANTWTNIIINAIPNDTGGTWTPTATTLNEYFEIALASGSTYQTPTVNTWLAGNFVMQSGTTTSSFLTTSSATFQLTGCQYVLGSTIGPFVTRANELQLAQQQYRKSYDIGVVPGAVTAVGAENIDAVTTTARFNPSYGTLVTTPAITLYSSSTGTSGKCYDATSAADVTCTAFLPGMNNFLAASNAVTAGHNLQMQWVANARL